LNIRNDYDATLIAIKTVNNDIIANPSADIIIEEKNTLIIFGKKDKLNKLINDLN
jgi:K+/H+ antiporter YhaU regulatory subunit KhtT